MCRIIVPYLLVCVKCLMLVKYKMKIGATKMGLMHVVALVQASDE